MCECVRVCGGEGGVGACVCDWGGCVLGRVCIVEGVIG